MEQHKSTEVREKGRNERSGRESKWGKKLREGGAEVQDRSGSRSDLAVVCVLSISALDNQHSEHQGRLESHGASNLPLAAVNAPSSGMYRNVVPAALPTLLPSLQIAPLLPAAHQNLT